MRRLALLLLCASSPALAFTLTYDANGDVLRWRGQVKFVLDNRFAQELGVGPSGMSAVERAVRAYDDATAALKVTVVRAEAAPLGYSPEPGAKNQNSIVVLDQWEYAPMALATTLVTVRASTNELIDADIAVNRANFRFQVLDGGAVGDAGVYDVQGTVTHELGHALGLGHSSEAEDVVMYPDAQPGELTKRTLKADDLAGLAALYAEDAFAEKPVDVSVPPRGCSSVPAGALAWLAAWAVLRGRARRAGVALRTLGGLAVLVVVGAGMTSAASPRAEVAAPLDEVAWAEVVHAQSRWLPGQDVIVTDAEVEVRACLRGDCPLERVRVSALGGRVGDLEQRVGHAPKVVPGAQLLVGRLGARRVVLPTSALSARP